MSGSLEDKVILITGSGSGIGRATALACAREGAQVVVSDLNPEWSAETTEQILARGGKLFWQCQKPVVT